MSKDAQQQISLFESSASGSPGDGGGARVSGGASRRRHVVPEKRVVTPVITVAKRESPVAKLSRVVNVRVPVLFLALGAVLMAMVVGGVYLIGVHRGKKEGGQETIARLRESKMPLYMAARQGDNPEVTRDLGQAPAAVPEAAQDENASEKPASGAVEKRKPGLNYLVMAFYPKDEADRLVAFLKARGLEAQTNVVHNKALYHVVALRGFDAQGLRSKEYQAYKQQILLLGREWNTRNKGPTNLSDVWPQRYDG